MDLIVGREYKHRLTHKERVLRFVGKNIVVITNKDGIEFGLSLRAFKEKYTLVPNVEERFFGLYFGHGGNLTFSIGDLYSTLELARTKVLRGPKFHGICKARMEEGRLVSVELVEPATTPELPINKLDDLSMIN